MTLHGTGPLARRDLPEAQRLIRGKCHHPHGTFIEFPMDEVEGSIGARFAHVVRLHGSRTAVRTRDRVLTYAQLHAATNRVARAIEVAARGVENVGLIVGHGLPAVVAVLATLKTGKAFVLMDPRSPPERLAFVLGDSRAGALLVDAPHRAVAERLARTSLPIVDMEEAIHVYEDDDVPRVVRPDTLAGLLYTSGSTGRPKGVPRTHRHFLALVRNWTDAAHICPQDRMTLLASATGQAITNILTAVLNGSALYPFEVRREGFAEMALWLATEEITFYLSSALLFREFAASLTGAERFPTMRLVRLASETVTHRDVESFRRIFPDGCVLVNALSLSETGTLASFFMDKNSVLVTQTVPVGYAMPGMDVTVRGDNGQPVPPGEVGEITVRSAFIPDGYWNASHLSAEGFDSSLSGPNECVFLTGDLGRMHADGCLEQLGRRDGQLKIRGFRVEPAEVERAILSLDDVSAVAVRADSGADDRKRLVAYVVAQGDRRPSIEALRSRVSAMLPDYMVPSTFVLLDALPVTLAGKLDRAALPNPGRARPPLSTLLVAPRDKVEGLLARIWAEVLQLDEIGVEDDFLDLGGDSLLAARIVSRANASFTLDLPMHVLFNCPTVAAMAAAIGRATLQSADHAAVEGLLATIHTLSDAEIRNLLTGQAGPCTDG